MTLAAKAALGWLLLFVVMFANGAIRVVILQPQLGEDRARQVASLSGVALVLRHHARPPLVAHPGERILGSVVLGRSQAQAVK